MNTLWLPELRELLREQNAEELSKFCTTLHPARTAEFLEGLSPLEKWAVLQYADETLRVTIFNFLPLEHQVELIEVIERREMGTLLAELPPDDAVDLLEDVEDQLVDELLVHMPTEERDDIITLRAYPEDSAGAVMTTEVPVLSDKLTARQATETIRRWGDEKETVYYLFVVDDEDRLVGMLSFRELFLSDPDKKITDIMRSEIVTAHISDDQEVVAKLLAKYDFLAIPIIDDRNHLLGIITSDDVIDVLVEEATEDAHLMAAIDPLEDGYLETSIFELSWKRGMWLTILFFAALLTTSALNFFEGTYSQFAWVVMFIPLVISSGGNCGSQSATLIITALSLGEVTSADWLRVMRREIIMGLILGSLMGLFGFLVSYFWLEDLQKAIIMPITLIIVSLTGTLSRSILPLIFKRLGLDPAMMSTPFVAGIIDILGIVIYMNVTIAIMAFAGS